MVASFLVRPLFDGLIDIVGDVHGEMEALLRLLHLLGYKESGAHPNDRKLVFLGDLTDRGPDSPAVIALVSRLVADGQAQCVLGNHDLNILLGHRKYDNGWFFGEEFRHEGKLVPQKIADEAIKRHVVDFFRTLPLALERHDLRVVHACWKPELVDVARQWTDLLELYQCYAHLIVANNADRSALDSIDRGLECQNRNPVKVLTSGLERRVEPPFEASGKLRNEERVHWWMDYSAPEFCIFGHYSTPYRNGRAICIDHAVGHCWRERQSAGFTGKCKGKLAAARFPEKVIVFDDGSSESIGDVLPASD